jgi:ABC-type oligopeptide transport system substrate-binding subunit
MKHALLLSAALMLAAVPAACGQAGETAEAPNTVVKVAGSDGAATDPQACPQRTCRASFLWTPRL